MATHERPRARRGQEVVTILKGRAGSRGKVEIRNGFGYREEVSGKDLEPINEGEPNAKLKFEDVNG